MKNNCIVFMALLVIFISDRAIVFAGGVEQNTNQSVEMLMYQSRNATLDTDAAYFNPAGTALMADGLHIYLSDQLILQPITVESDSAMVMDKHQEVDGDKTSWYFPDLFLVFKKWDMAFSLGFMGIGGGGSATFDEGLPSFYAMVTNNALAGLNTLTGGSIDSLGDDTTGILNIGTLSGIDSDIEFSGSSAYYSCQFNYAYALFKNFSLAVGYRFIYAQTSYKGSIKNITAVGTGGTGGTTFAFGSAYNEKVKTTQTGMAHGIIVGLDTQPVPEMNIMARFEYHTPLKLENDTDNDLSSSPMFPDGEKVRHTLPMHLAMGFSYTFLDGPAKGLMITVSMNAFFNRETNWEDDKEDLYDTGWEALVGFGYTLQMIPLTVGAGYAYATDGANDDTRDELNENLDSHTVGAGLRYEVIKGLKFSLAYNYVYYVPVDVDNTIISSTGQKVESIYSKENHSIGIGLEYHYEI